jgi:hypothetical protein
MASLMDVRLDFVVNCFGGEIKSIRHDMTRGDDAGVIFWRCAMVALSELKFFGLLCRWRESVAAGARMWMWQGWRSSEQI